MAHNSERAAVAEFFELFKTPWEFFRDGGDYDVLICCGEPVVGASARLVLIYGSTETDFDRSSGNSLACHPSGAGFSYRGWNVPIYGACATFRGNSARPMISELNSQEPLAVQSTVEAQTRMRIGYDLFQEIQHLLGPGQPIAHAATPTLEMHISFLRDSLIASQITFVEIPPVPAGHDFIACLTHDVDHVGIKNHKCDHTMFGFLYRATIGSVANAARGRLSPRGLVDNFTAALSLPMVHMGLARDFWYQFDEYLEIEKGLASTFFVIPHKNDSGFDARGNRPPMRAASYDLEQIEPHLRRLESAGHEIGVHGLDAWRDSTKGREELDQVSRFSKTPEFGIRMHWLFFDEKSPSTLEQAGFSYDSTVGYNETIGYRAGTVQVFRPLGLKRLLELPMHIMDTALFYPSYLNFSPIEAWQAVDVFLESATLYGGVLTINWHDRSIAPERLWDQFYIHLLNDLKSRGAWFPTASDAVSWFRMRRSVKFENVVCEGNSVRVKASVAADESLPGLRIRVHRPDPARGAGNSRAVSSGQCVDFTFAKSGDMTIAA